MTKMKEIVRHYAPLEDGQRRREVAIVRTWKLQKPDKVELAVKPCAAIISAAFGSVIAPKIKEVTHRQKLVGIEVERYRWMRPGPDGKLIPR